MRESHNRSEVQEENMECNRKADYFPVLFAFPIKVMFGILCTFGTLGLKWGCLCSNLFSQMVTS